MPETLKVVIADDDPGMRLIVRKMVERGEDCTEVLVQLAAVISALNSTGRVILKDHIAHCIVDAVESGDNEAVDSLNQAIDRFMR